MTLIAAVILGYLVGSFPTGLVIGRVWGADPRRVASGRTGATNVYRAAGLAAGFLTALGDLLKGTVAVLLARYLLGGAPVEVLAGVAAVAGHNWSLFLRMKGGAGTMTNVGGLAALSPIGFAIVLILGSITFFTARIASVASLAVAALVPGVLFLLSRWSPLPVIYTAYGLGSAALVVWALRPNIARLLRGDERRINLDLGRLR